MPLRLGLRSPLAGAPALLAATFCARAALAQTVSPTGMPFPDRIVNGQDLGVSTRPQNLNPLGVSFADCAEDMSLRFSVTLSGFTGAQQVQVWASKTSPCTDPLDRGMGTGGNVCWRLSPDPVPPGSIITSAQTFTVDLRVQDIVGPQNATAPEPTYSRQGSSACFNQPTYSAVAINVNFVPVDTSGNLSGTAWLYNLNTDLVGPPAPSNVTSSVGDTLFNVNWTANVDSDTAAYDIFMDPIPGHEDAAASMATPEPTLICPDTGTAQVSDGGDDGGADGADLDGTVEASGTGDATTDAMMSTMDSGCFSVIITGTGESADGGSTGCNIPALQSSVVQDAGATTVVTDDAGDEASTVIEGNGGISTVSTDFLVNANNGTGVTVSDKSAGQYTVTGLINEVKYTAVVAAVDAYGNVGPSSGEVCDSPAPTQDFFKTYRNAGGGAGGGFCALEAAGAPVPSLAGAGFAATAAAVLRRRSRRKRSGR